MAKKKKKKEDKALRKIIIKRLGPKEEEVFNQAYAKFIDIDGQMAVDIYEFNKAMMCIYGANVNIARSFANIYDGLKPVERRILISIALDERLKPGSKKKKVAKIVGTCLGKYHPHGDASVTDTLCRMGQEWVYYPLLINGQGNYGSESGDPHAAMRYIEATIGEFAYDAYFSEWFEDITDFVPNFDGTEKEPEYLPSKYPVLPIKGTRGMGYALYGGIPPHNLNEVMDLTIELMDNPNKKNVWLYPDFPNGCSIVDTDFKTICETGKGKFRTRGKLTIEQDEKSNDVIVISGLAFANTADKIIETIKKLRDEKKLEGLLYLQDDCREEINIRIGIKKGFNAEVMRDKLYKSTKLEDTFAVVMMTVFDYNNIFTNLRGLILNWIDLRRATKRRIYAHAYSDKSKILHLNESIIQAIDDIGIDVLIKHIRKSSNRKEVAELLITKYHLTDIQAERISGMPLYELSKEPIEKFRRDIGKLRADISELEKILDDDGYIDKEIKKELREGKKKYGRPRQSEIISLKDFSEYQVIPDTEHNIVITEKGYIKKLAADTQGVGKISINDVPVQLLKVNNYDTLMIFDELGKCHALPVRDINATDINSAGVFLTNYIKIKDRVVSVLNRTRSDKDVEGYYVFLTKDGMIKKTEIKHYSGANLAGIVGVVLKGTDTLVDVVEAKKNRDIIIYTEDGTGIRYSLKDVNPTNRVSSGVRSIPTDINVIGCSLVRKSDDYIFVITNKGKGKKCLLDNFNGMNRSSKPLNIISLDDGEEISFIKCVTSKDKLHVYTNNGIKAISIKEVPELTRKAKAKKILPLNRGEIILKIRKI